MTAELLVRVLPASKNEGLKSLLIKKDDFSVMIFWVIHTPDHFVTTMFKW